jgi:hypothetical protein
MGLAQLDSRAGASLCLRRLHHVSAPVISNTSAFMCVLMPNGGADCIPDIKITKNQK